MYKRLDSQNVHNTRSIKPLKLRLSQDILQDKYIYIHVYIENLLNNFIAAVFYLTYIGFVIFLLLKVPVKTNNPFVTVYYCLHYRR